MATPIEIPKVLHKKFMKNPRLILDPSPGYWPIAIKDLEGSPFFDEIINDKEFNEKCQVVVMAK